MSLQRVVRKKIGELLVEAGILQEIHLKEALNIQKEKGGFLGEILVSMGVVTEEEIVACLAIQYGLPYLSLQNYEFDEDLFKLLPKEILLNNFCLPIDKMGKVLTVAVANPLGEEELNKIETITELQVKYFMCKLSDFNEVMAGYLSKE